MNPDIFEPSEKAAHTILGILAVTGLCIALLYQVPNFTMALIVMIPLVLCAACYMISTIMQDHDS